MVEIQKNKKRNSKIKKNKANKEEEKKKGEKAKVFKNNTVLKLPLSLGNFVLLFFKMCISTVFLKACLYRYKIKVLNYFYTEIIISTVIQMPLLFSKKPLLNNKYKAIF